MRTLVILLLILRRFVGDIYTSAGVYRYIRGRQSIGIRDEQGTDAVVMDGQFLNPLPVDLLSLIDLNVIDQLIYHSGCQLLRPCVLSHCGQGPNSTLDLTLVRSLGIVTYAIIVTSGEKKNAFPCGKTFSENSVVLFQ